MYITYHKKMSCSGIMFKVPFSILNEEIQEVIIKSGNLQKEFTCCNNGFYFIICLDNGDRIDVQL